MMLIIRPASKVDLPNLQTVFPRPKGRHWQRLQVQMDGRGVYLLALEQGELVGVVLLRWQSKRDNWTKAVAHLPRISDLHVLEARRGGGIGTALLNHAEMLAQERGAIGINLSVALDNPAKRLYERQGYRDVSLPTYTLRWIKVHPDRRQEFISDEVIILVKDL